MADDKHKSPGQSARANRGRRRPPPTIDLTATEVAAPEPQAEPPAPSQSATPPPDPTPVEAVTPAESPTPPREQPTPPPEPEMAATAGTPPPEPPEPADPLPPPPRTPSPWLMLGAGAGGGAVVAIVLLLILGTPLNNNDSGQQAARIDGLDAAMRELAARQPPAAADPKAVAAMSDRLAKLEAATTAARPISSDPVLADRITTIEKRLGALTEDMAAQRRRSDSNAAAVETAQRRADAALAKAETVQSADAQGTVVDRQDIAVLRDRLTALERTAQALQAELAQQKSSLAKQRDTRVDERSLRLALIAEMLKAAVARGEPFRAELDGAKALAADQTALAPLEAFADTGVPTTAALSQQLRAILPAMRRTVEPKAAADEGFLARLQVNAERLVRIRPIDERPGDDAGAILARVEAKASRGDIAGVLTELVSLPPEARAPAEAWIKTVRGRDAAVEASRRFAAAHVSALAGRSD